MAADELLAAEAVRRSAVLVRLYGWAPTTVSLGAFQRFDDAGRVAEILGVPIVRRPSGGGAIVHGSDLTYAAAVPKTHPWGAAPQLLYDALHGAMAAALGELGIAAKPWRPREDGSAEPVRSGGEEPFFCFDRRSSGDLVMLPDVPPDNGRGQKVMGSAQRRLEGVVLQHGSLLIEGNAQVTGRARHAGIRELSGSGAFAGGQSRALVRRWLEIVAAGLGAGLAEEPGGFFPSLAEEIGEKSTRFRAERWTRRR
jgi:lipoate-protein ligase A